MTTSIIRRMLQRTLERHDTDIELDGDRSWDPQIHDDRFYWKILQGSVGLGEAYMDNLWDAEELDEFFHRIHRSGIMDGSASSLSTIIKKIRAIVSNPQSRGGSKKIADDHYNRPADLFERFLDPYLQYTCGYYHETDDLDESQEKRLELICNKLHLQEGDRHLDIGCGWGGLAKYAAEKKGVEVTGITISREQAEYARDFTDELPTDIRLMDYRDLPDHFESAFDSVTVLGMIEHVGYKNYRTLMDTISHVLKDGGLFLLDTIGRNTSTTHTDPWIEKYIFPNSMLPSLRQIAEATEGVFIQQDFHNFGHDYDKTCIDWYRRFNENWEEIREVTGYDERFRRMWNYYLLASAGGFRAGRLHNWQFVFSNGDTTGYEPVRDVSI